MTKNSTTFIIESLKRLVVLFPETKASYQFDKSSITHFVEILPKEQFENNKGLAEFKFSITKSVIEEFPTESICWLSEDDLVSIGLADFHIVGAAYKDDTFLSEYIFEKYDFQFPQQLNLSSHEIPDVHSYVSELLLSSIDYKVITGASVYSSGQFSIYLDESALAVEAGENTYAMAA